MNEALPMPGSPLMVSLSLERSISIIGAPFSAAHTDGSMNPPLASRIFCCPLAPITVSIEKSGLVSIDPSALRVVPSRFKVTGPI